MPALTHTYIHKHLDTHIHTHRQRHGNTLIDLSVLYFHLPILTIKGPIVWQGIQVLEVMHNYFSFPFNLLTVILVLAEIFALILRTFTL